MPAPARPSLWWILAFCILLTIVNAAWLGPGFFAGAARGEGDFRGLYSGAALVGTGHLNDPEALATLHIQRFGKAYPALAPLRIPAYYVLLRPIVWLDYSTAAIVWKVIMLALLAIAVMLERFPWVTAMAFSACGATILALGFGQDLPLLLVAMVLFQRWRESSPDIAGLFLCLAALAKPHLVILVPLSLLVLGEWRVLRSLTAGTALAVGLSFWTEGPDWLSSWIATASTAVTNAGPQVMPNLHGLAAAVHGGAALEWTTVVLVVALVALIAKRTTPIFSLFVALLGSLLVSRHAYPHDVLLVVPGLAALLAATHVRFVQAAIAWVLSPLPFVLTLVLDTGLAVQLPLLGLFLFSVWNAADLGWRSPEPGD